MKSNTHVLSLDLILDVMPNGRLSDVHGPVVHLEFRHINNQPFWMIKRMILTLARIPRSAFQAGSTCTSTDVPSCIQILWIKPPIKPKIIVLVLKRG